MDIEQLTSKVTMLEAEVSSLKEEFKKTNSKLSAVSHMNIKLGTFDAKNVELKNQGTPNNSERIPGVESLYNTLVMMIRKEIKKSVLTTRDGL